jgi:NADPH:quinone reductase-like Zn-dependent oxidoreductase
MTAIASGGGLGLYAIQLAARRRRFCVDVSTEKIDQALAFKNVCGINARMDR